MIFKNLLKYFFIIAILFGCGFSFAQQFNNPFKALKGDWSIAYGLDNRRTHIQGQNTLIYGVYGGVSFDDQLKFKLGFSGTPFERGNTKDGQGYYTKNQFYFFNVGEEFDFYTIKRYSFTSYIQCGFGYNNYRQINDDGIEFNSGRDPIIPLEVGFNANYELWYWLQFKLGFGWRFVFPEVSNDLNGYYFKVGFGTTTQKILTRYNEWKSDKEDLPELEGIQGHIPTPKF
jgi:hypothetical protein